MRNMEPFMVETLPGEEATPSMKIKIPEHLFKSTPNDMELGRKVREIYFQTIEKYGRQNHTREDTTPPSKN